MIVIEFCADADRIENAGLVQDGKMVWLTETDFKARVRAGAEAVIVLHGSHVVGHSVELPNFTDAKLLKILPGLMEDKLSVAGEVRHFALLGERDPEQGTRLVGVIDTEVMDNITTKVKELSLSLFAIVPDYMLIPQNADRAVAWEIGGFVRARLTDGSGFCAEPGLAEVMLPETAETVSVSNKKWRQVLETAQTKHTNLLQGSYAPRGDILAGLVWFKRAGMLLATLCLVWFGSVLLTASQNNQKADLLYQEAEAVFREALPDVPRIVNMEAQMRRAVADARQQGGGEFFALSQMIFSAVQDNQETMLESLRYDSENGNIALSVSFASFAESERFKDHLLRAGARVTEGSSRQESARVFSDILVERGD
ncbi:MAG: type II secretion system protein GspL [Kordiimonas sp.]